MKKYNIRLLSLSILLLTISASCFIVCSNINNLSDNTNDNTTNISDFPIVGTNQSAFHNNTNSITPASEGSDFYGQNANYPTNTPSHTDN